MCPTVCRHLLGIASQVQHRMDMHLQPLCLGMHLQPLCMSCRSIVLGKPSPLLSS